jgi:hypothetical protein
LKATEDMPSAEDVGKARSVAQRVVMAAQGLIVNDEPSFSRANELAKLCKSAILAVEKPEPKTPMAKVQEQKENAHKLHKFFTELVGSLTSPYKNALLLVDGKAKKWQREENTRREAEAAKARVDAEKKANDEKLRLATELEERGDVKAAERVLDAPTVVETPKVEAVKAEGRTYVHNWKAREKEGGLMLLVKAIAEGRASILFVQANMAALNKQADSLKNAMAIPGYEAFDDGFYRG